MKTKRSKSSRGVKVKVEIEGCAAGGKAFDLLAAELAKINRRLKQSGGDGISYYIELKDVDVSTSS